MMTGARRCGDLLVERDENDPRSYVVVAWCRYYPHAEGNHQGQRIRQGTGVMEQWPQTDAPRPEQSIAWR